MSEPGPDKVAKVMWKRDRASRGLGMTLDSVAIGSAELSMTVRDDMLNGHAICHGGFIFALADSAFAFACNACNRSTVAAQCQVTYIRPAKADDRLRAVCREVSRGSSSAVYDVEVTRARDGALVAVFRGYSRELPAKVVAERAERRCIDKGKEAKK